MLFGDILLELCYWAILEMHLLDLCHWMQFIGDPLYWRLFYWVCPIEQVIGGTCLGIGDFILVNYWRVFASQLIGETLQVNYCRVSASQFIGGTLQLDYWRDIAMNFLERLQGTIGELLPGNYWRNLAGKLFETCCQSTIGETLQVNYWRAMPVNYWRSTAGKLLRHCYASIRNGLHITCHISTVQANTGDILHVKFFLDIDRPLVFVMLCCFLSCYIVLRDVQQPMGVLFQMQHMKETVLLFLFHLFEFFGSKKQEKTL